MSSLLWRSTMGPLSALSLASFSLVACSSTASHGTVPDAGPIHEGGPAKDKDASQAKEKDAGHPKDAGPSKPVKEAGPADTGRTIDSAAETGPKETGVNDAMDAAPPPPCAPTASCAAVDKSCIGFVSNVGKTSFGLRMAQIGFSHPNALATGLVASVVSGAAVLDDTTCNLNGAGTFSWLLQVDTTAGTVKTGASLPVTDPTQGYAFVDAVVTTGTYGWNVAPVTSTAPLSSGSFTTLFGSELFLPIYLDAAGDQVIVAPIQKLSLTGAVSADQDCIGTYNASGLDPANNCLPDGTHPQFLTGGNGTGFMTLNETDNVVIATLNESLCVALSGDSSTYGMTNAAAVTVCKRDGSNHILFQGDWCAATNAAASGSCFDSIQVAFSYAASSVLITN